MKIYNYDKDTKEYLGSSEAQKNPKQTGGYLMPPNSTTIMPPEYSDYEIPVFNGDYWEITPDYRNADIINTETHEIVEINEIGALENEYMLYSEYMNTEEYAQYMSELERQEAYDEILCQLYELDKKRIRAVCEPSVKDEASGETWLEYYNNRVLALRTQLQEEGYGS